jgi:hypothetical protein
MAEQYCKHSDNWQKPPPSLRHEKLMLKAENHSSAKLKIVFFSQLHSTAVVGK